MILGHTNLMPFSMDKKLNLGEITPTSFSLQIAVRSMTFPNGIIKHFLVKVNKFSFSVDFVVLDMEKDEKVSLIIGRPFLATSQALIDVDSGESTLRVGDDKVCLNIYKSDKLSEKEKATCMKVEAMPLKGVENMKKVPKETPLKSSSVCSLSEAQWGRKLNSSIHPKVHQNEITPIVREVDVMYFSIEGTRKSTILTKKHKTSLIPKNPISSCFGKHEQKPIIHSPG